MYRKWLLLAGVIDLFILSLLDKVAFQHYLYWRYPWFDIIMHLIGGVAIGLISAYVYWEWQKEKLPKDQNEERVVASRKVFYTFNLGFISIIGLGWEIFEVWADRIIRFNSINASEDLFFGIIGSLLAGLFVLWIHNYNLKKLK